MRRCGCLILGIFLIFSGVFLPAVKAQAGGTLYEAEAAYRSGYAAVQVNNGASGGAVVTGIGGINTDVGSVVFEHVYAPRDGSYGLTVSYLPKARGKFTVMINERNTVQINNDQTGTALVHKQVSVNLIQGENTIKIYSKNGMVLDLDCIILDTPPVVQDGVYEDTAAQLSGTAALRRVYGAENGSAAANLGKEGSAEFTVEAVKGEYDLTIWYSAADYRALEVYVDGGLADTIFCPITGETDRIGAVQTTLNLSGGNHKIRFQNQYSAAPDIDKIKLVRRAETRTLQRETGGIETFSNGVSQVRYDLFTGRADYLQNGVCRVAGIESVVKLEGEEDIDKSVSSTEYAQRKVESAGVQDGYGRGTVYQVVCTGNGLPEMRQSFYLYENLPYILVKVELSSAEMLSTNFMAPVSTSGEDVVRIGEKQDARALFVPYDNDNWVRYNAEPIKGAHTSHWVTALYDNASRNAVVCGSVDHDTFKTGTSVWAGPDGKIGFFGAFGGIWSAKDTYDYLPHGSISGTSVSSPKMFLGYFEDWRDGMETYGQANANNVPKLNWPGGTPFGYNSWYAQGSQLSYDESILASDTIKELSDFESSGKVAYINLDSYWDNLSDDQLRRFVQHCKANGQKAGIYWSHFVFWATDMTYGLGVGNYSFRDAALEDKYGNVAAMAKDSKSLPLDPTSEAMKARLDYLMKKFVDLGFEFLKVDFLNYAALEGAHADPKVQTGMQAYNQALELFTKYVDTDQFFISYSIAPVFPYQYGHSRRISCDVSADIGSVEYLLNSLNYGWWMDDTIYSSIDADHIGLTNNEAFSKTRYQSAVISGGMMLMSNLYSNREITDMTKKITQNKAVNDLARLGRAFRPVEGNTGQSAGQVFMLETQDAVYVAMFQYGKRLPETVKVELSRLGLDAGKSYQVTDLWDGGTFSVSDTLTKTLAAQSSVLYRIAVDQAEPAPELFYLEDFEEADILNIIKQKQEGWSYDAPDTSQEALSLWVGDCGGNRNSLQFMASEFFKSMWTVLDLKESGIVKQKQAGMDTAEAERRVQQYLSQDVDLSFSAKFERYDSDPKEVHESYIRIKGDDYHAPLQLSLKNDTLYLVALSVDGTQNAEYKLCDVYTGAGTQEWHDFVIRFRHSDNSYRLTVDGEVFQGTPFGEWIPASSQPEAGEAVHTPLGPLGYIETGHVWSGYAQIIYLDDIAVRDIPSGWKVSEFRPDRGAQYGGETDFTLSVQAEGRQQDERATVIVASYDGGTLYDAEVYQNIALDETGSFSRLVRLSLPAAKKSTEVKVYIWDERQRPLLDTPYGWKEE